MLSKRFVLCTRVQELARDRRGVTAVVTGIALTVILGFAGLEMPGQANRVL
jgi:Flp pilus assembly protein TadG